MAGAAVLAGRAAVRSGAGLVRFLLPSLDDPIYPILQTAVPEATCVTPEKIEDYNEYQAIAAGSGLGDDLVRRRILRQILCSYKGSLILDADALNMISREEIPRNEVLNAPAALLFTPHIGEAKRLLKTDAPIRTEEERLNSVQALSKLYHACVLLKGPGTLILSPSGTLFLNTTGGPGMAAGGSGDVLSGIIAACAGQGLPLEEAAACGAFIPHSTRNYNTTEKRMQAEYVTLCRGPYQEPSPV
jgi:NAD(P)H-hydrate epimerase